MKKSMIAAGAASLALAAMPVVGVFAATTLVDELELTVASSCQMTNASGTTSPNEYSAEAGLNEEVTFTADSADTELTVVCNSGYTITPTFTPLDGPSTDDIAYDSTLTAGKWTASYKLNGAGSWAAMTSGTAITSNTSSTTDAYTFQYKAHTTTTQTQGTYTGSATYVLAAVANS